MALLALVPAPHADASALELVRILAIKLAAFANYVAEVQPQPDSIDDIRAHIDRLLSELSAAERHAALTLIIADVQGDSR